MEFANFANLLLQKRLVLDLIIIIQFNESITSGLITRAHSGH
jgi:hypothetical protein